MEKSASHLVGQKILDLANIEAGVVIFGQFVAGRPVEWVIIWVGVGGFHPAICLWFVAHSPREKNMNTIVVFLIGIVAAVVIVGSFIVWKEKKNTT